MAGETGPAEGLNQDRLEIYVKESNEKVFSLAWDRVKKLTVDRKAGYKRWMVSFMEGEELSEVSNTKDQSISIIGDFFFLRVFGKSYEGSYDVLVRHDLVEGRHHNAGYFPGGTFG